VFALLGAISIGFISPSSCLALDAKTFPGKGSRVIWNKACKVYNEGNALGNVGKRDAAIAKYKQAIEIYPYADAFYLNLGVDYEARKGAGDLAKAEAAYRKATSIDPKDWRNWNAVAGITAAQNKYQDCRKAALQALACNPPSKDAAEIRSNLASVEQYLAKSK